LGDLISLVKKGVINGNTAKEVVFVKMLRRSDIRPKPSSIEMGLHK
jgi:Asp-tRNA(Asn)/Glu-tRNA(Gln) amidotransferase B subunit